VEIHVLSFLKGICTMFRVRVPTQFRPADSMLFFPPWLQHCFMELTETTSHRRLLLLFHIHRPPYGLQGSYLPRELLSGLTFLFAD